MGRVWTIEERQKQADRIRSQKPWLKSTGPRTTRGKIASSRNALRHGCYGTEFKMISLYLKMQKHYIDTLRFMLKHDLFEEDSSFEISGNELNEKSIKSIQNDTFAHRNILVFPQQKTHPDRQVFHSSTRRRIFKPLTSNRSPPLPIRAVHGQGS